ncbi:hypothetical protein E2562_019173 [Oryza meyeriana var. granulata]|uniref:Uncharacterized protein n=1 Tax=Oryza meyeriana var. granulata TaxID=110450 RepID=A0A6G1CS32_9ORYZ|nr:hypothetical protein E2562_019173 [Oryza meyeriana var. granulata]
MEVERVAVGGIQGLQRPPRVSGAMGAERSSAGTSSLLSPAVQEMLMVQKSNKAIKKPPRVTPRLLPVIGRGGSGRSAKSGNGTEPAPERAARASSLSSSRSRQPLAKRVARSMLRRGAPPPLDVKRKVLTCCCARLPPGLRCALHQCAPGRSWMRSQRAGEAVAPRACGRGGWLFSEYARWRRSVWMPSRFYLEGVDRQPHAPHIELDAGRR